MELAMMLTAVGRVRPWRSRVKGAADGVGDGGDGEDEYVVGVDVDVDVGRLAVCGRVLCPLLVIPMADAGRLAP